MPDPILLVGAGGHAKSCIDVIEQEKKYEIVGLIGLMEEIGSHVCGYPILGCDKDLHTLLKNYPISIVSVGQIKTPSIRMRLFEQMQELGCEAATIISPYAYVSPHAQLGEGTIVMHGAVINAGVRVGRNCIINSQSLLEHDVEVGDHCHISTSSSVNSGVKIGRGTFIGSGSRVRQCLNIGENCFIGMGEIIRRDCPDGTYLPLRKQDENFNYSGSRCKP